MVEEMLRCEGMVKEFPGVLAVDGADFNLKKGEIHALLGENGAGKTTLVRLINGIYSPDGGKIFIEGEEVKIPNPRVAEQLGIAMVHQELSLMPNLTATQNIVLGQEPSHGPFDALLQSSSEEKEVARKAVELLGDLGEEINLDAKVEDVAIAERQGIEIARAIAQNARILILDEPTSALAPDEVDALFDALASLKEQGISIIYITHYIDEVQEICDVATVLRNGSVVDVVDAGSTSHEEFVKLISGEESRIHEAEKTPGEVIKGKDVVFAVENLTGTSASQVTPEDISLELHEGEVLGITGLVGAGKTETARLIWGVDQRTSGQFYVEGEEVEIRSPVDAVNLGMALVPENRRSQGLVPDMALVENLTLPRLRDLFKGLQFTDRKTEAGIAEQWISDLDVKASSIWQKASELSGGNQQKVIIARWLETEPKILLVDEPTRGIDVGVKRDIRRIIRELAESGVGIILFSSEITEVISIADRIMVMDRGRIVKDFGFRKVSEKEIMAHSLGNQEELRKTKAERE